MAYGHPLGHDTLRWDELTEPVPDDMRREDGHRTFGLMDSPRGPWRGQGVARRLHETLLDGVGAERVLLDVHPVGKAASAAYRAWDTSRSARRGIVQVSAGRRYGLRTIQNTPKDPGPRCWEAARGTRGGRSLHPSIRMM